MNLSSWSQSEVEYGRKVLSSGLAGARSGQEAFLHGKPFTPFLCNVIRNASTPAAVGAIFGLLGSLPGGRHPSVKRTIGFGFLGLAIGFGVGIVWQGRGLAACAANGALRNIGRVRDEHWLESHPIDYA
jgi:hypothetical protein